MSLLLDQSILTTFDGVLLLSTHLHSKPRPKESANLLLQAARQLMSCCIDWRRVDLVSENEVSASLYYCDGGRDKHCLDYGMLGSRSKLIWPKLSRKEEVLHGVQVSEIQGPSHCAVGRHSVLWRLFVLVQVCSSYQMLQMSSRWAQPSAVSQEHQRVRQTSLTLVEAAAAAEEQQ